MAQGQADMDSLIESGMEAAEEILHRAAYDPVKAREYYLRTRQLKGRRPAAQVQPSGRRPGGGTSNAGMRPSRRKQLEAEKAKLEKRIEELKHALELLVEAAKKRAGVKPEKDDKDPKETADRNSKEKKGKPLTEKQKREKREAAREQYEKEKGMTLSVEVSQLREQAQDIRAQLQAAIADARQRKPHPSSSQPHQTASNGR